jgi:hypothetical protein
MENFATHGLGLDQGIGPVVVLGFLLQVVQAKRVMVVVLWPVMEGC